MTQLDLKLKDSEKQIKELSAIRAELIADKEQYLHKIQVCVNEIKNLETKLKREIDIAANLKSNYERKTKSDGKEIDILSLDLNAAKREFQTLKEFFEKQNEELKTCYDKIGDLNANAEIIERLQNEVEKLRRSRINNNEIELLFSQVEESLKSFKEQIMYTQSTRDDCRSPPNAAYPQFQNEFSPERGRKRTLNQLFSNYDSHEIVNESVPAQHQTNRRAEYRKPKRFMGCRRGGRY